MKHFENIIYKNTLVIKKNAQMQIKTIHDFFICA